MRTFACFAISVLFCFSCFGKKVPKDIRKRFTNCYNGESTGIRTLLEIDGYYVLKEVYPKPNNVNDTFEINLLFYEDGSIAYNFFDTGALRLGKTAQYLEQIAKGRGAETFYNGFYWGIYRISGDTIIAQLINNPPYLAPWQAWQEKFVVTGRQSFFISKMETVSLEKPNRNKERTLEKALTEVVFLPAGFRPSVVPKPDSWLKREPWTKCK